MELSHVCHLHSKEINTGIRIKKTPDITNCCPLTAIFQKSTVQSRLSHCQFILQLLARSRQLSFVHDLLFIAEQIRPRSQTASEALNCLSIVLREPISQLQTSTCPTYHKARLLQRLSNNEHIDGRPLVLQRCWAPNCQQMIVQTLTLQSVTHTGGLSCITAGAPRKSNEP